MGRCSARRPASTVKRRSHVPSTEPSGDLEVVVAEGSVENGQLVGLPELDAMGGYWWSPIGLAMAADGTITVSPDNASQTMPDDRQPLPGA